MKQFIIYNYYKCSQQVRELRTIQQLRKNCTGESFLDVGSGSKRISRAVEATTLDIDRRNAPDIVGEICHLPIKTSCFETVSAFEVIEHVDDDEKALRELKRVSINKVVLTVPNADRYKLPFHLLGKKRCFISEDHKREYTINQMLQLLSKIGLHKNRLRGIGYLIIGTNIGFEILAYFLPWFSTWIYIESSIRKRGC